MKHSQERIGEIITFFEIFFWALCPVIIRGSNGFFSPLFFMAISMLISGVVMLLVLLFQGSASQLFNKKALPYMLAGTFFIMLVYFPLQFIAGQKTLAGNMAVLNQVEALFTAIFFGLLGIEAITKSRMFGIFFMIIGATFILSTSFTGNFVIWDFIIVLSAVFAPFGNVFQKRSVQIVPPKVYICFKNLIAGVILLLASLKFEDIVFEDITSTKGFVLIFLSVTVIFGASPMLFLEGIKRIDVSKVIALNGLIPAISLLFAIIFLGEAPTYQQVFGFFFAFWGVHFLTRKDDKSLWPFAGKKAG